MVYETNSEALNFITVRPLYEDARDDAPVVSPAKSLIHGLSSEGSSAIGQASWGWRRNWQQQHMFGGNCSTCMVLE